MHPLSVDDIRKLRVEFSKRHTDENGQIDWAGAIAETEAGAAVARAEIARIRAERGLQKK